MGEEIRVSEQGFDRSDAQVFDTLDLVPIWQDTLSPGADADGDPSPQAGDAPGLDSVNRCRVHDAGLHRTAAVGCPQACSAKAASCEKSPRHVVYITPRMPCRLRPAVSQSRMLSGGPS